MDKWINKKGWLDGYVNPVKKNEEALPSERVTEFAPLRCPECRSRKVRCYGADRPVLYYKCMDCETKFKVIEREQ